MTTSEGFSLGQRGVNPMSEIGARRALALCLLRNSVCAISQALPDHPVPKYPDVLHLELDHIARVKEAQLLEPAAVADRARAEELAGMQRLRARRVRDAVLEF